MEMVCVRECTRQSSLWNVSSSVTLVCLETESFTDPGAAGGHRSELHTFLLVQAALCPLSLPTWLLENMDPSVG